MTAAIPEQPTDTPPPADTLIISRTTDSQGNTEIRVENAPLPERIEVTAELWDELEVYNPEVDGDTGLEPPPNGWLEVIPHAGHVDGDGKFMPVDNDGYVLHIEATNVSCAYRFNYAPREGQNVTGVLISWGEK
jgi:hypothetical protein